MGLLGDIFSYGDGLKRKARGLLTDPMGTLSLGATRFGEDQNKLFSLMADSGYLPGDKSVLNTNKASSREQLAKQATEAYGGLLGATVWHGSPHKFDKFDSGKIGTGEGAQAYGHGLYLADQRGVAGGYAERLANQGVKPSDLVTANGTTLAELMVDAAPMARAKVASHINAANGDIKAAKASIDAFVNEWSVKPSVSAKGRQDLLDAQKWMADLQQRNISLLPKADGNLYKVDLPDEHIAKMINADAPIEQAPQAVQDYYKRLGLYKKGQKLTDHMAIDQWAAKEFQSAGIPGIRYLDGGSRAGGAGSSNYVVFPGNEGLLQILERNGQAIK